LGIATGETPMMVHFDNRAAAEKHLRDNGWTRYRKVWVSRTSECYATILTVAGRDAVCVAFREL
jgi:hypothetical protein